MTPARRAKLKNRAKLKIDVLIDSDRWKEPAKARAAVRRAVGAAAATASTSGTEVAIVLTDDSAVRELNRLWRGIDAPTNVLSFPSKPTARAGQDADEPPHLGDIVLAYETVAREAKAERKPFAHHVAHLAVHGFLHLVGYDHDKDADAETMEATERKILRGLHIPDPYRAPGKVAKTAAKKTVRKR
jgi:probable rRNA maturation factor